LIHTTPEGSKDVAPLDNVRLYHFAGGPHNIGRFPPMASNGEIPDNPFDYRASMRALIVAMEKWVRDGAAPPPSRYPRLQDSTLVRSVDVSFPTLRGITSPRKVHAGVRGSNRLLTRDGGAGTALPYLVPQVDRDGNAIGGLRLPEMAVPLATYTGWNFRSARIGGTEQFFPLIGAYVPFAATKAEREQSGDARLSIQERYPSRERYLQMIQQAATPLVNGGYLLLEDVPAIVKRAGDHWDLLNARSAATAARLEK
jgi:alpha/beta hydrolase family protein